MSSIYKLLPYAIAAFVFSFFLFATKNDTTRNSKIQKETTQNGTLGFCASDYFLKNQSQKVIQKQLQLEEELYQKLSNLEKNRTQSLAAYTLPVVVHIIHNNGAENISDATVLQGIQDLNNAFSNQAYYDQGTGVDTEVAFCLAKRDPDGNATTGINRVVSALTQMTLETEDLAVKDLIRWDPTSYINIWLVQEICSNSSGCGVAGYAYFPSSHGSNVDGILMEAEWFGSTNGNSGVQIHEMGHYLGVYHTFEGGCTNSDCLADGDRVCDTPPDQSTAAVPCNDSPNSCTTDVNAGDPNNPFANDQNDMFWNYMDYGDWDCYSAFTQGQTDRMSFFIEGARASLLNSDACLDPCNDPLNISFTIAATTVNVGSSVSFNNTSTNANNFDWLIDGVSFATTTDASYLFNTEGLFQIVLQGNNNDPNCFGSDTITISVQCPVEANFIVSSTEVKPTDVVIFTNTSINANAYEWFVDGVLQTGDTNFDIVFGALGNYEVYLVGTNNVCTDTSFSVIITVSPEGLAQTGLPVWPILEDGGSLAEAIDWTTTPTPTVTAITNNNEVNAIGQTGAAFNNCGQLVFYVIHTGASDEFNLYVFAPDGTALLTNTTANAPGLNAVRGGNEIQVIRVPDDNDEWFIIYNEWSTDVGSPINNAGYNPARMLYSRVRLLSNGSLDILERDIVLTNAVGTAYTYTDGKAVSRTAGGNVNAHYLYACRRTSGSTTISLDRFIINNTGITFDANTGSISATWWNLTIAGSPIELSPTEDRIAVANRNQNNNDQDVFIFDAAAFNNTSYQVISANDLILQADGTANDLSSLLPYNGAIEDIAYDNSLDLAYLRNFERKMAGIEFSPNGRFLYLIGGGYGASGTTNLTYLAQIDLEVSPFEVRLQIQTTPNGSYNATTGLGCNNCFDAYNSIGHIESCFDGNLYFSKRIDNILYVIPDPNNFLPQNLLPSNVDLSTVEEPNLILGGNSGLIPDQIDGFNYLRAQSTEVEFIVNRFDCFGNCDVAYTLNVIESGEVIESFLVDQCPDTLSFCADTSLVYDLVEPLSNIVYQGAITEAEIIYPVGTSFFDFSDIADCIEQCDNGIDDDGDGLVDCLDPDLTDSCCCIIPVLDLDLGADIVMCDFGVTLIEGTDGFDIYQWQDGSDEKDYTAWNPGTYWLDAFDGCEWQSDTIVITIDEATILDIGNDTMLCAGDSIEISLNGFSEYDWFTDGIIACDTCGNVWLNPDTTTTYVLVVNNENGCYSVDTIVVEVLNSFYQEIDTVICMGASFTFDGVNIPADSSATFNYTTMSGCDSIYQINVIGSNFTAYDMVIDTQACIGSSIIFDGVEIPWNNSANFAYTTIGGCDSLLTVNVIGVDTFITNEEMTICDGDSALVFGNYQTNPGIYSETYLSFEGCDSVHTILLFQFPLMNIDFEIENSCAQEATGSVTAIVEGGLFPYQYTWSNGANEEELIAIASGAYILTVADQNGCSIIENIIVDENPSVSVTTQVVDVTCFGGIDGMVFLLDTFPTLLYSFDGEVYQQTQWFDNLPAGNYILYIQDENDCIYMQEVEVNEPPEFLISLGEDHTIELGDSIELDATPNEIGMFSYVWNPIVGLTCDTCMHTWAQPNFTTQYTVMAANADSCIAIDSVLINIEENRNIYIPNVFSPDNNGINDLFQVYAGTGVVEVLKFKVFDRWGELVYDGGRFEPNNQRVGWDGHFKGREMKPSVFVYIVEVAFVDGKIISYEGDITLIR